MLRSCLRPVRRQLQFQQLKREFKARPKGDLPAQPLENSGFQIVRPIAFTVGATCTFYAGAAIFAFENRNVAIRSHITEHVRRIWPPEQSTTTRESAGKKAGALRQQINAWWNGQHPGQRVFWGIFAANAAVLGLWQIPRLSGVMARYFLHSASSRTIAPMLLANFSHKSVMHFSCNMFVLYSFSHSASTVLGQEQFVATYLSAGVISALASHLHQVVMKVPTGSLGASGAIMGILGVVCSAMPDARLCVVFLPMLTFGAFTALKSLIVFDSLGLVCRWMFFDHAAHLGGALFGLGYVFGEGHKLVALYQSQIVDVWRQIRSKRV